MRNAENTTQVTRQASQTNRGTHEMTMVTTATGHELDIELETVVMVVQLY